MAPLVVDDALQVVVEGQCLGRPWTTVYGLNIDDPTPLSSTAAGDIVLLVRAYYEDLAPLRSTQWSLDRFTVTDIRTAGGPQFEFDVADVVGTGSANALPPDLAIVVTWLTSRRGGSFRGRTFHNGFTEEGMAAGRLLGTALDNEEDAAQAFIDSFPGGLALAVISRKLLEANVVTGRRVNDVFDHQTRRRFPQ